MELYLYDKFELSNPYNFATWKCQARYFKFRLFDLIEFIVWNIYKGIHHCVDKIIGIENHSLWKRM